MIDFVPLGLQLENSNFNIKTFPTFSDNDNFFPLKWPERITRLIRHNC